MKRYLRIIFQLSLVSILFIYGCTTGPKKTGIEPRKSISPGDLSVNNKNLFKRKSGNSVYQVGIASWYGDKFHGKRTSNGEIYDMNKLTAAHKELPFNTIVEVENLDNRKKVLVRINDRGPFVKDRIIDLSYLAAKKIGMAEKGTAPVVLRIVKISGENPETPVEYSDKNSVLKLKYYLQGGAFKDIKNAETFLFNINEVSEKIVFKIIYEGDFYKVVSEDYESKSLLLNTMSILKSRGFTVIIREKH